MNFFFFQSFSHLQKAVLMIAIFYIITRFTTLIIGIPIAQIVMKLGLDKSFVIANLLYTLYLVSMFFASEHCCLIFFAALINGIQINFFWNSYHTILSKHARQSRLGKDLGVIQFFLSLATMISPAIGGFVIVNFGYPVLFLMGLLIVLFSLIFSMLINFKKVKDEINLSEFLSWVKERTFRRLSLSFAGRYINDSVLAIWPLYVFVILGAVDKVGFLYSISLLIAMIVSYFIGSFIDQHKNKKPFFVSGGVLSLLWFLRTQIANVWSIAVVDSLGRLTSNFHWMFFDRLWLIRAKGREPLSYFVYREMVVAIAAIIFWLLFAAVFVFFTDAWKALFVIASVGVMLSLLIKEKKEL
ncbi:MAG: MFS transporter [Candidatus Woesebacteria bacterium]